MEGVRLSDVEILELSKAFRACFLPSDRLWIFGSRTDLTRKGGNIDLYIATLLPSQEAAHKKIQFLVEVEQRLGEQKIDVVLNEGNCDLPIHAVAKKEGIQLI